MSLNYEPTELWCSMKCCSRNVLLLHVSLLSEAYIELIAQNKTCCIEKFREEKCLWQYQLCLTWVGHWTSTVGHKGRKVFIMCTHVGISYYVYVKKKEKWEPVIIKKKKLCYTQACRHMYAYAVELCFACFTTGSALLMLHHCSQNSHKHRQHRCRFASSIQDFSKTSMHPTDL